LRPATAYGLSPRIRFDIVLNNLVAWAVTRALIYLKSDGSPWRPIVHIEDISRGFIAALEAPVEQVHNEAFNVGCTEHNYRIRDIAEIVADVVPGCRVEIDSNAGPDTRSYRVDFAKIARVLPAFRPEWNARRGAEQLFAAYRQSGLTLEEFEGPRYQRIGHIQKLIADGVLAADLRQASAAAA
jgi:nucleoside-diphosphate-sugar epimerase